MNPVESYTITLTKDTTKAELKEFIRKAKNLLRYGQFEKPQLKAVEVDESKERWKILDDYPEYAVSDYGRVKRLERIIDRKNGRKQHFKEKIIKPINSHGYASVNLHKNGKSKQFRVHRLVYETFKGEIEDGYEIDHRNCIKSDNRLDNLKCVSHLENMNNSKTKQHISESNGKKVFQIDIKTHVIIAIFNSAYDAERKIGIDRICIHNCVNHKAKSAGNYLWEFVDDETKDLKVGDIYPNLEYYIPKNNPKRVKQIDPKTGEVLAIYNSIAEAERKTGISAGNICMAANHKRKSAGNYLWEYADDEVEGKVA